MSSSVACTSSGDVRAVAIRGADDGERAVGQCKHDATVARRQHRDRVAIGDAIAGDGNVRALAPVDGRSNLGAFEAAHVVAPRPRGADDHACPYGERLLRHRVDCRHLTHRPRLEAERRGADVIGDDGARLQRTDRVGQREPRIVGRGVVVFRPANEPCSLERGLLLEDGVRGESVVRMNVSKHCEPIVQTEHCRQLPSWNAGALVHRPNERKRADDISSEEEETSPILARIEDEAKLTVFEVPDAAVYQA